MEDGPSNIITFGTSTEGDRRKRLISLLRNCPIPDDEILTNVGLFIPPATLSRILFLDFLYKQILEVQGVVIEFGCRWGQSLSLFSALRGIYEPFNRLRKIVGFDTFTGFLGTCGKDGPSHGLVEKNYSVSQDYEQYLGELMDCQEQESPLSHLRKHEIIKGDAVVEIEQFLSRNPETIIALAYFDLDLYEPTLKCLSAIKDRLTRGSIIGFDELNEHMFPGETLALKEVFGLDRYPIRRFRYNARASYMIIE